MTKGMAIQQGGELLADIVVFKAAVNPTSDFVIQGKKLIELCAALEQSTRAFMCLLSSEIVQ